MAQPVAAEPLMNLSVPWWLDSPELRGLSNQAHRQLEQKVLQCAQGHLPRLGPAG